MKAARIKEAGFFFQNEDRCRIRTRTNKFREALDFSAKAQGFSLPVKAVEPLEQAQHRMSVLMERLHTASVTVILGEEGAEANMERNRIKNGIDGSVFNSECSLIASLFGTARNWVDTDLEDTLKHQ